MKRSIVTALVCLCASVGFSQKVKFKKDVVLVDEKELFTFEQGGVFGAVSYDLSELNSKKLIVSLVSNNAGTHMEMSDDYTVIKFMTVGKRIEIHGGDVREGVKLLLKHGVISKEGILDESKIDLFVANFDDRASEKR